MHKKISIKIPIRTVSENNTHGHWSEGYKRHKIQKSLVNFFLTQKRVLKDPEAIVTLKRYSPRSLDSDNLQSSFKYIRDAVADYLIPGLAPGQADSDSRIQWNYSQVKSKEYLIEIEFEWLKIPSDSDCKDADSLLTVDHGSLKDPYVREQNHAPHIAALSL